MKRKLITLLAAIFTLNCSAQSYIPKYVPYTPIESGSGSTNRKQNNSSNYYQETQRIGSPQNVQIISAYTKGRNGWQRINIKVGYTSRGDLVVCGIKTKDLPYWQPAQSYPQKVSQYDDAFIYNNFDYKCFISGDCYIYF